MHNISTGLRPARRTAVLALTIFITLLTLLFVVSVITPASAAGTKSITGRVRLTNKAETVIVRLLSGSQQTEVARVTLSSTETEYRFDNVAPGSYTIAAASPGYCSRTVTVTVTVSQTGAKAAPELVLNLRGDVNGDGDITTVDAAIVNSYVRKQGVLTGYALACADIIGKDGRVTTSDVAIVAAAAQDHDIVFPAPGNCTHSYTPWMVVKDTTCTEDGIDQRICVLCGTLETRVDKALGHVRAKLSGYAPTCTATGLTDGFQCTRCAKVLIDREVIPMVAHTLVLDKEVPASCTKEGLTEGYHCSVCGYVDKPQEIVPVKKHMYITTAGVAPTCTQSGKTEGKTCVVCHTVFAEPTRIPPLGHDYQNGICTRCNACSTVRIPDNLITQKSGHHYYEVEGGAVYITNVWGQWRVYYGTDVNHLTPVTPTDGNRLWIGASGGSFLMIPRIENETPGGRYWAYNESNDLANVKDAYFCRGSFTEYGPISNDGYWNGKRWLIIGDSLSDINSYASSGYPYYVASMLGMEVTVRALSGKKLIDVTNKDVNCWQLFIDSQADDYDLITVMMGTNDCQFGGGSTITTRIQTIINALRAKYPQAVIGYMFEMDRGAQVTYQNGEPIYQDGSHTYIYGNNNYTARGMTEYVIAPYCAAHNIPFVSLCDDSWNIVELPYRMMLSCCSAQTLNSQTTVYAYDGLHPTDYAQATIFSPRIAQFIASLAPDGSYKGAAFTAPDSGIETMYTITNNLSGCTTDNPFEVIPAAANRPVTRYTAPNTIKAPSYYARLTPDKDRVITSITVTVGGRDVTSSVVTGNTIFIRGDLDMITGDIVITARTIPVPGAIQLSTTDGEANRDLLNELLELSDVALVPGVYPIAPGVIINGHTLDLCGSQLIGSVKPMYNGPYFRLIGDSPCLRNGRISGNYSAGPNEPGYLRLETPENGIELGIGLQPGDFGNALVEDVEFDHISGYAICPCDGYTSWRHYSPTEEPSDGWCWFELQTDAPYISARHGVGYNYCISLEPVVYRFYNAAGTLIAEKTGIPGDAVTIPAGSASVATKTTGPYMRYCVFEYWYDNTITIRGCTFRCNQRMGISNLPGVSILEDCYSVSNGYPREDHTGISSWDSSTTGLIDIEDVQTPILIVRNCRSENEHLGVASRAYKLYVTDCPQLEVFLYGGWTAEVYNVKQIYFYNQKAADAVKLTTDSPNRVLY